MDRAEGADLQDDREATRIARSLYVASRRDAVGRDPLKLVYTGVLKGSMIQAIGIRRYFRNEGSVQSLTGPADSELSIQNERLRPPIVRCADDGLDRPPLPVLPARLRSRRTSLYGNDHGGGDRPGRCAAAPRLRSGGASRRLAARRQRAAGARRRGAGRGGGGLRRGQF